ncbi:DBH-like monooxygenase protein 1 homolog [Clavelina lepadiformis]|uniref:DBH-like monooxygenase protein 1 homolog n=1 Tax=Clavelina lepadiformis TaxID=159417 RepID=UPI0040438F04
MTNSKQNSKMKLLYGVLFCFMCHVEAQTPSENYPHFAVLDSGSKVHLYWKFNDTYITFEVIGQTTGWVGVGISPNGGMASADIYVGWVKNGVANVTDRHGASTNIFPPIDAEQNVKLLVGSESDGWTNIKFERTIVACSGSDDIAITTSTLRIIWALGTNDPSGNDITPADYHGGEPEKRGVKSLLILESGGANPTLPDGETYENFTMLNDAFNIPAEDTYYNCRLFEIPPLATKHHMVIIEPVIQAGNEANVHHILLYQCQYNVTLNASRLNTDTRCYASNMFSDFLECSLVIHAWAIGGGTFYYPNHVGFPLGEADSPKYVVMETHYDNPNLQSGIVDSSGLRVFYTSQLRQYDAGVLEVGHLVYPFNHLIPPNADSYLSYGECHKDCLAAGLAAQNQSDIKVFGVNFHTHLLGQALTLQHIRDGTELPYLGQDVSYDFNYQETKLLNQEVTVQSGDTIQLICDYNSKGRSNVTIAGLATTDEMCLTFVSYYPKIPTMKCVSVPWMDQIYGYFGITNYTYNRQLDLYGTLNDVTAWEPPIYAGQTVSQIVNGISWNQTTANSFSDAVRKMIRIPVCLGQVPLPGVPEYYFPRNIRTPYVPPSQCVDTTTATMATMTSMTTTTGGSTSTYIFKTTTFFISSAFALLLCYF